MAAIVFVHSSGASSRLWQPVSALLADRYEVHAPDLPGHGGRPGPFTVDNAVDAVRDALPPGRSHLVGISAGATVAVLTCLAAPDRISSVVLSGGIAHPPALLAVQRAVMAVLPAAVQARVVDRIDPALGEDFRRAGKPTVLAVLRALASIDLRPRLAGITVPALVAVGSRDRANLAGARELAAGLPHAEHVAIPDAGHLWCVESPQRFADLVSGFVDRA